MSRGRGNTIRSSIVLIALVAVAGCKGAGESKAAAGPSAMLVGPENIAVVKAEEIRSGPAISGNITPEEQAQVRSEIGGTVLQTLVEQGRPVSKGQVIARIDDATLRESELAARSAVTTAQNTVDLQKRQLDRNEALLKAGAIAERDIDLARNQYTASQGQLASAKAQLANAEKQLSKASVTAPFSGIVSMRSVSAGDVVQPGAALFTIVNPSTMRLEASVPANELAAVRLGIPVDFTVNGYPNRHFTGRITNINPVADPTTRQVRIIASIPNAGNVLVGGLFADGHVASEVRTAPVLPIAAVDERGLRPFVMRIKNGLVEKTEVDLGIRDAATETVEVKSGVAPGDTILLGAARGISEKTPVKVSATADTGRKP